MERMLGIAAVLGIVAFLTGYGLSEDQSEVLNSMTENNPPAAGIQKTVDQDIESGTEEISVPQEAEQPHDSDIEIPQTP